MKIKFFTKKNSDNGNKNVNDESSIENNFPLISKRIPEIKKESLITSVIYAFLIAMLIRTFFYEPFHIPSGSMKPGLVEGDFILVSKFSYGYGRYTVPFGIPLIKNRIFDFNKPQRGDVVVFRLPANPRINYIKRLVGLPGDKITVKNGVLTINGEDIQREYVDEYFDERSTLSYLKYKENITENKEIEILQKKQENKDLDYNGDGKFEVPEGFYFFLGDNRDNSLDSRFEETGFIPYKNIVGKAQIIFFSKNGRFIKLSNWGKIIRFERIFKKIK